MRSPAAIGCAPSSSSSSSTSAAVRFPFDPPPDEEDAFAPAVFSFGGAALAGAGLPFARWHGLQLIALFVEIAFRPRHPRRRAALHPRDRRDHPLCSESGWTASRARVVLCRVAHKHTQAVQTHTHASHQQAHPSPAPPPPAPFACFPLRAHACPRPVFVFTGRGSARTTPLPDPWPDATEEAAVGPRPLRAILTTA